MLKLFNTLTNQDEIFEPIEPPKVKMYVCGPTVYDHAHLGHARCYITWDVLYRYLKFSGYDVTYCRNVTDVDDKIIKKAQEAGITIEEVSKIYYKSFENSMNKLNILKPDIEPYATKTIGEMIAMIKKLIEGDYAYEADGDVYFDVQKYKKYGQLSKQPVEDLMAGARVEANDKKKSPLDFALWKKDEKHGYKSPWGEGRPGWHIECSAMSKKFLGNRIDIHAGGADLTFPHHENELAQSECANGCDFVKYWLHNGFVTINKEKMSKSLGNFFTIDDILKTYDSNVIRFFILTNHYRMPVEFNEEALLSAKNGVKRLINAPKDTAGQEIDKESAAAFKEAMDEDLNTSKAMAVLFSIVDKIKKTNEQKYSNTLIKLGEVLGFDFSLKEKVKLTKEELAAKIEGLYDKFEILCGTGAYEAMDKIIEMRNAAREQKDWAKSDLIRNELDAAGIVLKDSKEGTDWEAK